MQSCRGGGGACRTTLDIYGNNRPEFRRRADRTDKKSHFPYAQAPAYRPL